MLDERQEIAERRVQAARAGLAGRVEVLEQRVTGAVNDATSTVRQTAGTVRTALSDVKSGAQNMMQQAADGMRQLLDVPNHVRSHPWPSVGAAAFAGFMTGCCWRRDSSRQSFHAALPQRSSEAASGLFGQLSGIIQRELRDIGESAIVAASHALKDNIRAASAQFASHQDRAHNGLPDEVC
jgi:ElaB/YqjD/DUF883 family membrane-anchored ribosome-binding protein